MAKFSHFDDSGKARMVDVGSKPATDRLATATCILQMKEETLAKIRDGSIEKGDVLGIARVAGIMAVKKTWDAIPLCHVIAITAVEVSFDFPNQRSIEIRTVVKTNDRTGVEMEALHGASICGLTIYDMCKSADREMEIVSLRLEKKTGGKSGTYIRGTGDNEPGDQPSS